MIALYLFFYIILQAVLPSNLFLFNIRPDFLLILVTFIGLFNFRKGIPVAIILGLIKDVLSIGPFGLNVFCFVLWLAISHQLSRQIYRDNKFIYLFLVGLATLGNYAIYFFLTNFLTKGNLPAAGFLFSTIFFEAIYNSLFAYLFFNVFKKCALNYSSR